MDLISRDKAQEIIPKVVLGASDFAEYIRDSVDTVFDNCPSAFEGKTYGEVVKAVFPYAVIVHDKTHEMVRVIFSDEVWDSPYKGVSE